MARSRSRGAKVIDFKDWRSIAGFQVNSAADTTNIANALAFTAPGTILRCRTFISAAMDATKQVGDEMIITFGLGIVSSDAVAVGGSAMPDPGGEPEYPWLWWGEVVVDAQVAAGEESWGTSAQRYEVDTKSMRRVKPGQSLVWVIQNQGTAGAPTVRQIIGQTRVLVGT